MNIPSYFLPLENEQDLIKPVEPKLERGRDTLAAMRDCDCAA
jgi:hypothetical protein